MIQGKIMDELEESRIKLNNCEFVDVKIEAKDVNNLDITNNLFTTGHVTLTLDGHDNLISVETYNYLIKKMSKLNKKLGVSVELKHFVVVDVATII